MKKYIAIAIAMVFGLTTFANVVEVPITPAVHTITLDTVVGGYQPSADDQEFVMVSATVKVPQFNFAGNEDVEVSSYIDVRVDVRVLKTEIADYLGFTYTLENYKDQKLSALETAIISIAVQKVSAALAPAP